MPQLDPTWFVSQLFWLAITCVALYFVLARFILPPLQDIVVRRQQAIAGDIAEAERLKKDADQARAEYERMMAQTRVDAQKLMQDTLADQKAKAEQSARELDRKVEAQLAESAKKINARKAELIEALAPTVTDLASMIVEKLTQRTPAADQVQRVVTALSKNK